jgi:hypothetical protein
MWKIVHHHTDAAAATVNVVKQSRAGAHTYSISQTLTLDKDGNHGSDVRATQGE